MSDGLGRSSALMASGTMVSRVLGLIRASQLAAIVGLTGLTADAFSVANTLPNNFYLLLAGGILNAILVPQIVKASGHADGGEDFVNRLLTLALILMAAATMLITATAPLWVRVFSDTQDDQSRGLAVAFAFLCLPQIFFYGLYTLLGQVLNARGHFAAYMWAPVVANVVALAGLLIFRFADLPLGAPPGQWNSGMIWIPVPATLGIPWGRPRGGLQGGRVDIRRGRTQPARLRRDLASAHPGHPSGRGSGRRRRRAQLLRQRLPPLHVAALAHHGLPRDRAISPNVERGQRRRSR